MSWLIWNIRGIHQCYSVTHLQEVFRQHDIQFLAILEPKALHHELPRFAFSIGFHSCLHGDDGNSHIWLLWKSGIQVESLFISAQSITVNVKIQHDHSLFVTCVYASCLKRVRESFGSFWHGYLADARTLDGHGGL